MNLSQKEYIRRINNVVDFIELNLHNELDLATIAGVANFSPYHFHRIFTLMTGEPIYKYIKRTRLEKAAWYLRYEEETPINDIAIKCGFASLAVFSRAFKNQFGQNASQYRDGYQKLRKNGKTDSKNGKPGQTSMSYFSGTEQLKKWRLTMNNIEVKEMPALNLVYCRHTGQFDQIGKAYEKLMRWAGPKGLLSTPDLKTVTVYHDDPGITEIEKVRQSACITVNGDVKTEGEFGKMTVSAGRHVVGRFEISATEFENAWNSVCLWMTENGYQPGEGHPYELYHNNHEEHPERKFILDICLPVKPL
jgi:AraC family transcriptional regulator